LSSAARTEDEDDGACREDSTLHPRLRYGTAPPIVTRVKTGPVRPA